LILKDIEDQYVRENFTRLLKFFNLQDLLNGEFKFFDVEILEANTIFSLPHGLKFIPVDIIVVSIFGDYNFYFRHSDFTKEDIKILVSGPVRIRFFAGSFKDRAYGRSVSDLTLIEPNAVQGSTVWYSGSGVPPNTLGLIGDYYLDTDALSKDVYRKTAALVWTLEGNILTNHPASTVTLDTSLSANDVVGSTVQEYINRYNEPTESQLPAYNGDGTINTITFYSSATQVVANRIFLVGFTYDASLQPLTETWTIYSKADGTTILKTITITYTWVANVLTNRTQVAA
jgi:hypothetical protein